MSDNSSIEWTDATWNPTTGCDRVSDGCDNCYALDLAKRLKAMGSPKYQEDGDPRTSGPGFLATAHEDALTAPLHWKKPRRVFVNSMSDLFHKAFTAEFIARVFAVMAMTPQHTYQVLTKRHARMRSLLSDPDWDFQGMVGAARYDLGDTDTLVPVPEDPSWGWPLPNVWLGVSVETQQWADVRVPHLVETPAAVRFLSCEPLLGPVDLTRLTMVKPEPPYKPGVYLNALSGHIIGPDELIDGRLNWVIAGGESGPDARPMAADWARRLRDDCSHAGVPFHFKQWGGRTPKAGGRELDGRTWDEFPEAVTVDA